MGDGAVAGAAAAVVSGLPSTIHAYLTRGDPLEASKAAGSILLPHETRTVPLLASAAAVHLALSLGWGVAFAALLPRRATWLWGALAGVGVAALDLGVLGRKWERVHALPLAPQFADHVAFGVVVGAVLQGRRRS
jgi:hypothetical protein